jgi:hypothetical protein
MYSKSASEIAREQGGERVAKSTVPLGTWLEPEVAKRLRLTAAVRGVKVWRLLNDALKTQLPELTELAGQLQETEPVS